MYGLILFENKKLPKKSKPCLISFICSELTFLSNVQLMEVFKRAFVKLA